MLTQTYSPVRPPAAGFRQAGGQRAIFLFLLLLIVAWPGQSLYAGCMDKDVWAAFPSSDDLIQLGVSVN